MNEIDLKVLDLPRERYGDALRDHISPTLYRTLELPTVARLAADMATRWGVVAAAPDGEDTAGRQKLRCLNAEELAEKACQTAAALWRQFERRGWLVAIPEPRLRAAEEKEPG